jgi:DAK2 domain fusion protein YloV
MALAYPRLTACTGPELRRFFVGGLAALERCAAAIDALNVFPVPDGDTGTNLLITVRHATEAASKCDRAEAAVVARVLAKAALYGARGNSGAIFAQLCAGFAASLDDDVAIEPRTWAAAWQAGAIAARQSVASPVEGTLLTVTHSTARAATEAAEAGGDLCAVWQSMAEAADATVAETPRMLPILARAHVVDAGALGLALFLRGGLHAFTGAALPDPSNLGRPTAATRHVIEETRFCRFCTQFTLRRASSDRARLQAAFAGCGECMDVVTLNGIDAGAAEAVRVHLHTDRPDDALATAATLGVVEDVHVEDMERQRSQYAARLDAADEIAIVSIVAGDGMRRLFESLFGVAAVFDHVHGPRSAEELAAKLAYLPCQPLIILPNDESLIERARAAASASGKIALVVPTTNMPQGVAAALAFNPLESRERNVDAMSAAAHALNTVKVCHAATEARGHTGATAAEAIAVTSRGAVAFGEDLVAAGEAGAIAAMVGCASTVAIVTVYYGGCVSQAQADALVLRLRRQFPAAEVEAIDGGQPECAFWVVIERHAD